MGDRVTKCAKCSAIMDTGILLDRGDHNMALQSAWVEGVPAKSFWHGFTTGDRERVPVTTYRCPKCFYLESYALPEAK